jgi:hypothetical protein
MSGSKSVVDSVTGALADAAHDLEVMVHQHAWHPISTAPFNHDLEVMVEGSAGKETIAFPCRKLNSGEWINSDLGHRVQIAPCQWRTWSYRLPLADHHSILKANDHSSLVHTHGKVLRWGPDEDL